MGKFETLPNTPRLEIAFRNWVNETSLHGAPATARSAVGARNAAFVPDEIVPLTER